ncbi:hypothetical protein P7H75_06185 [Vagococcus carniphilus]|uniref:major capsid protein n=1 Tax=Vagococcus carniphilus TaxID=218144 RepID=UPI00288DCA46|nr:hypothetical protein [Vagococcus carniphilus]MDT2814429.1 hypothetical protein [Vagococcus carniphilus]
MSEITLSIQDSLRLTQGTYQEGIIQTEGTELSLLKIIPFKKLSGRSHVWNKVGKLPDVPFRAIGDTIIASKIEYESGFASTSILGEEVIVDTAEIDSDPNFKLHLNLLTSLKVKAMQNKYERTFINGNTNIEPAGFDGVLRLVSPKQVVNATQDIYKDMRHLQDKVIDKLDAVFVMNKSTLRILENQNREAITFSTNEFGKPLKYFGVNPIIALSDGQMPFNTVICMNLDEDEGVCGITSERELQVRPLGESTESPSVVTRIEWLTGIAVLNDRALAVRF